MKHVISLKVKDIEYPVEINIGEQTFKKIAQHCKEKYPDRNWKTSDSN